MLEPGVGASRYPPLDSPPGPQPLARTSAACLYCKTHARPCQVLQEGYAFSGGSEPHVVAPDMDQLCPQGLGFDLSLLPRLLVSMLLYPLDYVLVDVGIGPYHVAKLLLVLNVSPDGL